MIDLAGAHILPDSASSTHQHAVLLGTPDALQRVITRCYQSTLIHRMFYKVLDGLPDASPGVSKYPVRQVLTYLEHAQWRVDSNE
jgi:hypothetical protein